MILSVVDSTGAPQLVSVPAPGQATDASGVVAANLPLGGPFTYQQIIPVPATSTTRSGWFVRNRGTNPMYVSEDTTIPSAGNLTSVVLYPGETFPPQGVAYPASQNPIYLAGTAGDGYSAKVW
jgi:hypothetical protein